MKRNMLVAVVIFLLALLASSIAWANGSYHGHHGRGFSHQGYPHHPHHGHHHSRARVDVIIGAPLPGSWHYRAWPGYYAQSQYYVYAYPPVLAMQSSPPVYVERGGEQDEIQQPSPYWYYCDNPHGYYPYVRICPRGWQQVPAQPPTSP